MTHTTLDVAIVGAGPAGSTAAERLAAGGARVAIFDHTHPREKVCAGGISAKARNMFPFLDDLAELGRSGGTLRLVSPSGYTATVGGGGKTFAIDRTTLDRALLDRAVAAGADWRPHKVLRIERQAEGFALITAERRVTARLVIGADGVYSLVRRELVGPLPKEHLAIGAHVVVPDLDMPSALIRFLGDRRGYAWVFNRKSNSSIGVGMPQTNMAGWADTLQAFFATQVPDRVMPRVQGWALPQASRREFFSLPTTGDDWLLVGDAAGHVDPLTGEGIWYAIWGGTLAAEAILAGHPQRFDLAWREAYLPRLEKHLHDARRLENRRLLDALVLGGKLPLVRSFLFGKFGGA